MYYVFATTKNDKMIEPDDALLARHENKRYCISIAENCNAIETYIMNGEDVVIWQSWPEEEQKTYA